MNSTLAFLSLPGGSEWIILGLLGLLIFGRRLPEVARSVGRSILEFKRGLRDVQEDAQLTSGSKEPHALPPEQRPPA